QGKEVSPSIASRGPTPPGAGPFLLNPISKSEIRCRNPKSECRKASKARIFGFWYSDLFRISTFGFRLSTADFDSGFRHSHFGFKQVSFLHLPPHLIEIDESLVHDALAGADFDGRYLGIRAVAAFGDRLDRGEVLMIVIAIPQEEEVFQA